MVTSGALSRRKWIIPIAFGLVVFALYIFPRLWYSQQGSGEKVWFAERADVEGWSFEPAPISEAAERTLVADRTINGEFRRTDGEAIRVFSAKRYLENPNEIGLFVHTPDRCWVQGGWRIEPIVPEFREITVHKVRIPFERRLFQIGGNKELVYFFGLVDGQPLPYRLDHNLSASARMGTERSVFTRTIKRAGDAHFWNRILDSFTNGRRLSGAKQFFRISTPVEGGDVSAADKRLELFLEEWLVPGDYEQEWAQWRQDAPI
jgi:hypothetical protein